MALDRARQSCRFLLSRISSQVDDLQLFGFPGHHSGPKKWIDLIRGLLATANLYLEQSEDAKRILKQKMNLIQDANDLGTMAYRQIRLMFGVGPSDLPFPIVPPLQRWYQQAGLSNTTLFRAELVANYEIRPFARTEFEQIRDKSKSLEDAIDKIDWPLERFTVPARAFGLLPHFAIVAHEIGHAIYHNIKWVFPNYPSLISTVDQGISKRLGVIKLDRDVIIYRNMVYLNWLQEIVSDAFGLLIAGPAFFFALCELIQSIGGGLGIADTHPSNNLRREILFDKLTRPQGFGEVFDAFLKQKLRIDLNSELFESSPHEDDLFKELKKELYPAYRISPEQQAAVLVELPSLLRGLTDEIYTQAENHLKRVAPDMIYTPPKFKSDLEEHYRALLEAIPPSEMCLPLNSRTPVEFATILNVGWAVLLVDLEKISVKDYGTLHVDAARSEKLHSLLLKGLELSEARRDWMEI